MRSDSQVVVFSSLDAGLLEGLVCASGSVFEARDLFQREGIPLVLCSIHTRAQVERTQQELGIKHPFVVENGSAALIPAGYFPNGGRRTRRGGLQGRRVCDAIRSGC